MCREVGRVPSWERPHTFHLWRCPCVATPRAEGTVCVPEQEKQGAGGKVGTLVLGGIAKPPNQP